LQIRRRQCQRVAPLTFGRSRVYESKHPLPTVGQGIELSKILEQTNVVVSKIESKIPWRACRPTDAEGFQFTKMPFTIDVKHEIDLKPSPLFTKWHVGFSSKPFYYPLAAQLFEKQEKFTFEPTFDTTVGT
jgi:hypothetical protein